LLSWVEVVLVGELAEVVGQGWASPRGQREASPVAVEVEAVVEVEVAEAEEEVGVVAAVVGAVAEVEVEQC